MTDPAYVALPCTPMHLHEDDQPDAGAAATAENPMNAPAQAPLATLPEGEPRTLLAAMMTTKYWGPGGVDLFGEILDVTNPDLRAKILGHMNAWGEHANVRFRLTNGVGAVRIATGKTGHWSYIGTDIKLIRSDQPTMNLQDFSLSTPDREFFRVVRHETGHTLGCPHEHMRAELVARIDPEAAIDYYFQTQHWNRAQVVAQVLTPLEQGSLMNATRPDMTSIMCYEIPGDITRDGNPILGGTDLDESDRSFIARCYPLPPAKLAAPVAVASAHRPAPHADAIVVELRSGPRITVPPHAPERQVQQILAALHADAR